VINMAMADKNEIGPGYGFDYRGLVGFPFHTFDGFLAGKKRVDQDDGISYVNFPARVAQPFEDDSFLRDDFNRVPKINQQVQ
jgi:hypothetical protein